MSEISERVLTLTKDVENLHNDFNNNVYVNGNDEVIMGFSAKQKLEKSIIKLLTRINDLALCIETSSGSVI